MRIVVISMTTWGEMGNWLSGKSLGAALRSCFPEAEVNVVPAESLVPRFAATGESIKELTRRSATPAERQQRYSEVLRSLETDFPAGFEDDPAAHAAAADLAPLANLFRSSPPDLVVGTKGIICRAAIAASRLAGLRPPVINYVTNHGHFEFAVHHCPGASMHMVRFAEGGEYLRRACGLDDAAVRVVGYLVAAHQMNGAARPEGATVEGPARQSVIIVSNRGAEEYLEILDHLTPFGDSIDVTFIAINDEPLCAAAEQRIAAAGIRGWRTVVRVDQAEFFKLMAACRERGAARLVVKSSPNSIFEAVHFGMPMFLLRTGLPMEEWGGDIVLREGLGHIADTVKELMPALDASLRQPSTLDAINASQEQFRRRYLDQEATLRAVRAAVMELVAGVPAR